MLCFNMERNGKVVAHVVTLPNRKCIVSWPTSTIVYDSEAAARAVHIEHMGGRGESTRFVRTASDPAYHRGVAECYQDYCEGVPLQAAKGALPGCVLPPEYIPEDERVPFCIGYESMAMELHGLAWSERARAEGASE